MTTTLVAMNRQSILFTAGANDRVAALEMAQSGLNRVIDRWGTDASFAAPLSYKDEAHRRGYDIAFSTDPDQDLSINNLMGSAAVGNVPPMCARVIVTGYSGSVTKRIRCVVSKSLFPVGKPVSAAEHMVTFRGDFTLNGIKNPGDESGTDKIKAGLHTNRAGDLVQPAMRTEAATVHVEETSFVSAVTPKHAEKDFDDSLRAQLEDQADALKPDASRVQLARTDVPAALARAESIATEITPPAAPPAIVPPGGGDPIVPPYPPLFVRGDRILGKQGAEAIVGPIEVLDGSTLYVRGSLRTPVIRGKGNVVVGEDVLVTQGARLVLGNAAVSLVAAGDIEFHGTGIKTDALTDTPAAEALVTAIQNALSPGELSVGATSEALAATTSLLAEVNALPNPDPQLVESLTDLRVNLAHFNMLAQPSPPPQADMEKMKFLVASVADRQRSFKQFVFANQLAELTNPNFGRGHFQGLAFAGGNLTVGGKFRVIGGLEAGKNMELGGTGKKMVSGSDSRVELTYCEAYRNLCPAGLGSPYLVSYQEE